MLALEGSQETCQSLGVVHGLLRETIGVRLARRSHLLDHLPRPPLRLLQLGLGHLQRGLQLDERSGRAKESKEVQVRHTLKIHPSAVSISLAPRPSTPKLHADEGGGETPGSRVTR